MSKTKIYKTLAAIGRDLHTGKLTEKEAVEAYKLMKVNKETQKLVKKLNEAAAAANFKKPKK